LGRYTFKDRCKEDAGKLLNFYLGGFTLRIKELLFGSKEVDQAERKIKDTMKGTVFLPVVIVGAIWGDVG